MCAGVRLRRQVHLPGVCAARRVHRSVAALAAALAATALAAARAAAGAAAAVAAGAAALPALRRPEPPPPTPPAPPPAPPPDPPPPSPVWKLVKHVCHVADSDGADGEDGLGDILDRVGKAYVRSATAFARYAVDSDGCAHATNAWAVCDAGTEEGDPDRAKWAGNTFLRDQLLAAAASQPHAGSGGTGRGKIVTLEEMLVRLAGLAVVAHVDRTDGLKGPDADKKSTCFGNPSSADAKTMCDNLHTSYMTWLGNNGYTKVPDAMGSTSREDAPYNEFYHNPGAMHTGTPACPEDGVNGLSVETDKYLTAARSQVCRLRRRRQVWAFRQQCLLQHRLWHDRPGVAVRPAGL